jgi:hypothetical protein
MIISPILTLKAQVIDVLDTLLGTYTLPNGDIVPAIAVDNGNYPPQGTKVEGLEVVIVPQLDTVFSPMIDGREWKLTSVIVLKQWGVSGTTLGAMEKIIPLLGNQVKIGARVLPDNSLGNIETLKISFTWNFCDRI